MVVSAGVLEGGCNRVKALSVTQLTPPNSSSAHISLPPKAILSVDWACLIGKGKCGQQQQEFYYSISTVFHYFISTVTWLKMAAIVSFCLVNLWWNYHN